MQCRIIKKNKKKYWHVGQKKKESVAQQMNEINFVCVSCDKWVCENNKYKNKELRR